jgi:hypothetical protein
VVSDLGHTDSDASLKCTQEAATKRKKTQQANKGAPAARRAIKQQDPSGLRSIPKEDEPPVRKSRFLLFLPFSLQQAPESTQSTPQSSPRSFLPAETMAAGPRRALGQLDGYGEPRTYRDDVRSHILPCVIFDSVAGPGLGGRPTRAA